MPKLPCPVCGDPNAFPLWIDDEPPPMCPHDPEWPDGPQSIRSVADCPFQRKRAEQRALWRKVAPDCFDQNGNMLPDRLGEVLTRVHDHYGGKPPPLVF